MSTVREENARLATSEAQMRRTLQKYAVALDKAEARVKELTLAIERHEQDVLVSRNGVDVLPADERLWRMVDLREEVG